MTQKILYIFTLSLFLSLVSCKSESEEILTEKIENVYFDFDNLKKSKESISWNYNENIQYGLIHLANGVNVKFWFLSHHETSDIGGTIYEYPNGERQFCGGLHCCEVQFYENGKLGKTFKNEAELKKFVTEKDGIRP
jgi:hypothetical protein